MDILTIGIIIANITTVYLAARGNRWTWIFGVATGVILCYNFFNSRLFMSFAFQVYSTIAAVMGVFVWKKSETDNKRSIRFGNPLWPLLAVVVLTGAEFLFDKEVLHSNLPLIDCLITALQATATFLMVRKDINAWIMYLICDCVYIPLGIISGNLQWLFISACFLATATYGTITFVKAYRKGKRESSVSDK